MSEKPEVGLYIDGWRPEPAVRDVAQHMIEILFSNDATGEDCVMALNTLWEAVDPHRLDLYVKMMMKGYRGPKPVHPPGLTLEEIAELEAEENDE